VTESPSADFASIRQSPWVGRAASEASLLAVTNWSGEAERRNECLPKSRARRAMAPSNGERSRRHRRPHRATRCMFWQLVKHAGTDGEFANQENGRVAHGGVYSLAGPVFGLHSHVRRHSRVRAGRGGLAATLRRDAAKRSSDGCDAGAKAAHHSRRGPRAIHQIADSFCGAAAARSPRTVGSRSATLAALGDPIAEIGGSSETKIGVGRAYAGREGRCRGRVR